MLIFIAKIQKNHFFAYFEFIEDPRILGLVTHPLEEILFVTFISIMCGSTDCGETKLIAEENIPWFQKFFAFDKGIPTTITMQRVLSALNPDALSAYFQNWMFCVLERVQDVVVIDGKTSRGSKKESSGAGGRACYWNIDSKTNETIAIPELLEMLWIAGCVITIDAMGAQRSIASAILEKHADYVLALKSNQGSLNDDVRAYLSKDSEASYKESKITDYGHGRIETRKCRVLSEIDYIKELHQWPGLQSIIEIEFIRTFKKQAEQKKNIIFLFFKTHRLTSLSKSFYHIGLQKIRSIGHLM